MKARKTLKYSELFVSFSSSSLIGLWLTGFFLVKG